MSEPFIVFGAPDITEAEIREVVQTLESGWLGTGPRVAQFEAAFAEFKEVQKAQAAAVNSCTAALHLSLLSAGVGEGDEVITTPLAFCATVNVILNAGATPVLVDVDPATMNIDPTKIDAKITSRTKAILPVHFTGLPCDMDAIMSLAKRHELKVIEDCAHALETRYKNMPAGTIGDFGCFSFYVTKNVTTGEGGMILAKNSEEIERIKVMSLHGISRDAWNRYSEDGVKHYEVVGPGFKYNMMDLQAAIGIHQLKRVQQGWKKRQELWQKYQAAFSDLPISLPPEPPSHVRHGYHLYTLIIEEARCGLSRDRFIEEMAAKGIGTGIHYLALSEHGYYQQNLGWKAEDTPHAVKIGRSIVSLPFSPKLTGSEVNRIIEAVRELLCRKAI